MEAIFVRHASAEAAGEGGDEARRLTPEGKAESRRTAEALKKLGVPIERILTSPLVRARQTAEIVAAAFPQAKLEETPLLAPGPDSRAKRVRKKLQQLIAAGVGCAALVGHAPSLDECIALLIAGETDVGIALPKAGVACVDLASDESPTGAELRWLLRRKHLARMAGDVRR